jgi:hypothetical protein
MASGRGYKGAEKALGFQKYSPRSKNSRLKFENFGLKMLK